jgi:hypothetical protein
MKVLGVLAALCLIAGAAAAQTLKTEPPIGSVPEGKRLLVDDGTCPAGQIKEIVGGNIQKRIKRRTRCIKRSR